MSKADLLSKWCPLAEGGSGTGNSGERATLTWRTNESGSKGKSVNEVTNLDTDEVFMETEDGEIEQVQAGGNKKRIRSEAKGEMSSSYNLEDVD